MRVLADDLLTVSCSLLELEILGADRELIIYHESRILFFIQEFPSARILGPLREAVPYRSKIFQKRKDLENFKWSTTFSSSSTFLPDPRPPPSVLPAASSEGTCGAGVDGGVSSGGLGWLNVNGNSSVTSLIRKERGFNDKAWRILNANDICYIGWT